MTRPGYNEENREFIRTGSHMLPNSSKILNQTAVQFSVGTSRPSRSEPMSWEDLIPSNERDNSVFRETIAWAYLLGVECGRRVESSLQAQEVESHSPASMEIRVRS